MDINNENSIHLYRSKLAKNEESNRQIERISSALEKNKNKITKMKMYHSNVSGFQK